MRVNKFVKAVQATAQNSPLGAQTAAEATRATEAGLTRVSNELANDAHPAPVTPETAGNAAAEGLKIPIEEKSLARNEAYKEAWAGRDNPQFTEHVPVRMEAKPVLDAEGKPTGATEQQPVYAPVNMPVGIRALKETAAPIYEEMKWKLSRADQSSNPGFNVLEKLLSSDDFVPAWQAEHGLSALKSMSRVANASGVRDASQGIGATLIPELQQSIDAAVAKTGQPALEGLQSGRAIHASLMDVAEVADKLRNEPVQAFNQLVWRKDTGVEYLRKIDQYAPDALPKIGRAFVEQLFDDATKGGGWSQARTILKQWDNLGPETKALLFRNPYLRQSLDNFFKGSELWAENPNPSGTALVSQATSVNPLRWLMGYAGGKLLFSPRGVKLLTEALKPSGTPFVRSQVLQMAGGGNPPPPVPPAAAPAPPPPRPAGPSTNPAAGGIENSGASDTVQSGANYGRTETAGVDTGRVGEGPPVSRSTGPVQAANPGASATSVRIPGSDRAHEASYKVVELADLQPSHSGITFTPNSKYGLRNDRNYSVAENQRKVIEWSTPDRFDPRYHITDNPDATNGPPIIDTEGNVLGGNGRGMILQRVYSSNPKGAQAYRDLLLQKAPQYGIDPAQIARMKQPVLVREIPDTEGFDTVSKQRAITDFNKKGTAELKPSEKAIADSRGVSQGTLDDIAGRLESKGPDATLADILEGRSGPEILQKLIDDGVVSPQESAAYAHNNVLTPDGKTRISKLMLGRFFKDPEMLDRTPASIRNKLERMAAPLATVEGKPAWSLGAHVQEALSLLEEANAHGAKNLDDFVHQSGLFEDQSYSPNPCRWHIERRPLVGQRVHGDGRIPAR